MLVLEVMIILWHVFRKEGWKEFIFYIPALLKRKDIAEKLSAALSLASNSFKALIQ